MCSDLLFFAICHSIPAFLTYPCTKFLSMPCQKKNPFWFYPSLKYPSLTSHTCLSPPWIGYHFYVLILLSTYLSLWASLPCRYFCRVFHCISGPCVCFCLCMELAATAPFEKRVVVLEHYHGLICSQNIIPYAYGLCISFSYTARISMCPSHSP